MVLKLKSVADGVMIIIASSLVYLGCEKKFAKCTGYSYYHHRRNRALLLVSWERKSGAKEDGCYLKESIRFSWRSYTGLFFVQSKINEILV